MKQQLTTVEILNKLPNDWSEITFDFYLNKLLSLQITISDDPVDSMMTNIQIISLFTDLPVSIVEQFPVSVIKKCNDKLIFLSQKPKPLEKSKLIWKSELDEPTYDDFITFVKVTEQLSNNDYSNFPLLIKVMLKTKLTDDAILSLPMTEVETGFFLLRRFSLKYLKSTIKDLNSKLIVMKTNEMAEQMNQITGIQFKKRLGIINTKFKELMDFTSSRKKSQTSQT